MKKTNTWLSLIAAVLAVGALVGLVACFGRSMGTTKPAETKEEEVVLTNKTVNYAYRQNMNDGRRAYLAYSDTLIPNTKYRIEFDFNESDADIQAFFKQYSLTAAYAYDTKIPDAGDTFGYTLTPTTGDGMKSGYYQDFQSGDDGTLVLRFVIGPKVADDETTVTDTDRAILSFIEDHMSFRVVKKG